MGLRKTGRKPLPSAVKRLAGTAQPCRMNPAEPNFPGELPPPPPDLSDAARAEWDRLVAVLQPAAVVTAAEYELLVLLAREWARLSEAEAQLRNGLVVLSPSGFPMQSPWLAIARASIKAILAMLTELGMTPSSRTKVRAETPKTAGEDLLD